VNEDARKVIIDRSRITQYVRSFLVERGFLEVETPVLSPSGGGAAARPFTCRHHQLDTQLFLRVAPELFLKQLVIGGFDRVFEIGKQFRNEGLDRTHNPEFTSCEFYEAWADYYDLMETTEQLLSGLVTSLGLEPHHRGTALRLDAPFHRAEFLPSLEAALGRGLAPAPDLDSETSRLQLAELCRREGLDPGGTAAHLLDRLAGKLVEPELVQPTLLLHHPAIMSPLSKAHRDQPGIAERFELFIGGQEVRLSYYNRYHALPARYVTPTRS
jgi:lysyl-tRNA synthetase class 2